MPNCKVRGQIANCTNVTVEVLAPEDSIYMMYREYKVKDGAGYKKAPIIVSTFWHWRSITETLSRYFLNFQKTCDTTDNENYLCNDTACNITTGGGGEPIFLYICGDFTNGIMQVTGGNLDYMLQYCASIYNCTDPDNCWMEDISTGHSKMYEYHGVMAVSVWPGCAISGEILFTWKW